MPRLAMAFLLVIVHSGTLRAWDSIDDFEAHELSDRWISSHADLARDDASPAAGEAALRCVRRDAGAWFGVRVLPGQVASLRFRARSEEEGAIEVELRSRLSGDRFWRKADLRGGEWQEVSLPVWQFRTDGTPRLDGCDLLAFRLRGLSTLWIDSLEASPPQSEHPPLLEPVDALASRAFGKAEISRAETRNFRVVATSKAPAQAIADGLEAFLDLFQQRMGLPNDDLDVPVTLVIHETREEYVEFVASTAKDGYGGVIDPKGITSAGFTFERYSCTWYDPEQGAERPVFYHEACHQLVTQCLGLRGPAGASWAEEGICYHLQNEYVPQATLADEVGTFLQNPKRPLLSSLSGATTTTGVVNMAGMLVIAFMTEGPRKDRLAPFLRALRESDAALEPAVGRALGMKMGDFDSEWEAWVRETYR